jgi:hypothetical protein
MSQTPAGATAADDGLDITIDPRLEVRMTDTMGRGVFAVAPIRRAATLGTCFTITLPAAEVAVMAGTTPSRFWFEDADGSAALALGIIELINHSPEPNVDRRWIDTPAGPVVQIFALREIAAGEQLYLDYKFDGAADDPPWARTGC